LAHAFLVWGFCAFLIAEIDHFATPFDYSFIPWQSSAGLFYFWFVFLFALCCTISLAGLAFTGIFLAVAGFVNIFRS